MEVVTSLSTDRLLRDGDVLLVMHTEVSPVSTGAGYAELKVSVFASMHVTAGTHVGICVYVPIYYVFSSFPHCWSYLTHTGQVRALGPSTAAIQNSKGLHHTDFQVNGAPGGMQYTGLLMGLGPVGLAGGPTCMPRACLAPTLPVKGYSLFFCGLPCLNSAHLD